MRITEYAVILMNDTLRADYYSLLLVLRAIQRVIVSSKVEVGYKVKVAINGK